MQIQRIPLVKHPAYTGRWYDTSWALVDGPLAIRPLFEYWPDRAWVVCHVPSGLLIDVAETKAAARDLLAALQGTLPTTGTLGERPADLQPAYTQYQRWYMAQVW